MTEYEAIPLGLYINGVRVLWGTVAFMGVCGSVAYADRYSACYWEDFVFCLSASRCEFRHPIFIFIKIHQYVECDGWLCSQSKLSIHLKDKFNLVLTANISSFIRNKIQLFPWDNPSAKNQKNMNPHQSSALNPFRKFNMPAEYVIKLIVFSMNCSLYINRYFTDVSFHRFHSSTSYIWLSCILSLPLGEVGMSLYFTDQRNILFQGSKVKVLPNTIIRNSPLSTTGTQHNGFDREGQSPPL